MFRMQVEHAATATMDGGMAEFPPRCTRPAGNWDSESFQIMRDKLADPFPRYVRRGLDGLLFSKCLFSLVYPTLYINAHHQRSESNLLDDVCALNGIHGLKRQEDEVLVIVNINLQVKMEARHWHNTYCQPIRGLDFHSDLGPEVGH